MKLSVIIPAFNRATLLRPTIDSVLNCGVDSLEIVVVDDGSTDQTADVIREYGSPVRYLSQANAGPAVARNTGLTASSGEYVAFLDSDDLWFPGAIRSLLEYLESHQEIPLVFGDAQMGSPETGFVSVVETYGGDTFRKLPSRALDPGIRQFDQQAFFRQLVRRNIVFLGSLLARRNVVDEVGHFDPALFGSEDWHFVLRLALRYPFTFCEGISVATYSKHGTNLTRNRDRMVLAFCLALEQMLAEPGLNADQRALVLHHLKGTRFDYAYAAYDQGDFEAARQRYRDCLRVGFSWKPFLYWMACQFPPAVVRRARHLKQRIPGAHAPGY